MSLHRTWRTHYKMRERITSYFQPMDKKQLAQLLKYSSPYSILIVRWDNRLIEVYCPFKVLVIGELEGFAQGEEVRVWKVMVSTNSKTVFIISGKPYYYYHFDIMV